MTAGLREEAKKEATEIAGRPSQPNEEDTSSNVRDRHLVLAEDETRLVDSVEEREVRRIWMSNPGAANSKVVPRTMELVSWSDILRNEDRSYHHFSGYDLGSESLTPSNDHVGDTSRWGEDGNDRGGNDHAGDGAPKDDDYGDWGKDFNDGYGEGPSGSWQPDIGGGFRKPGGGYYDLASVLEKKMVKMSLK